MSSSQEAAAAVRELERQLAEVERRVVEVRGAYVRKLQELSEQRIELEAANRKLGKLEGALAAMQNPRGYGGAVTWGNREALEQQAQSRIGVALPTFRGYVVDERLQEFRMVTPGMPMRTIPFDSAQGQSLLRAYRTEFR